MNRLPSAKFSSPVMKTQGWTLLWCMDHTEAVVVSRAYAAVGSIRNWITWGH